MMVTVESLQRSEVAGRALQREGGVLGLFVALRRLLAPRPERGEEDPVGQWVRRHQLHALRLAETAALVVEVPSGRHREQG